jgi:FkbM family methyltransferase
MTRKLYTPCRWILRILLRRLGFLNWESMEASGEVWFLDEMLPVLLATRTPMVLDVGANSGDYTELLLKRFPQADVHAFEPHPVTFQSLKVKIEERANCHPFGLGSTTGQFKLYDSVENKEGGIRASLCKEALTATMVKPLVSVDVQVSTMDIFIANKGVERVDFLKIDTEGYEMDVLDGARRALADGRIGIIQFEFNELHIARRQFLLDFMLRLPSHRLYRLVSDGMVALDKLKPYEREIFAFQNIVAIPREIAPFTS